MVARQTSFKQTEITYSYWLVFDYNGGVRLTRMEPSLSRDERAMAVETTLPRAIFKTPTLTATIDVQATDIKPASIDISAAQAAMKAAIGMDVVMRVVEPE